MKKILIGGFKLFVVSVLIVVFQGYSVLALSAEQKKLYQGGIKYFNWEEECSSGSSSNTQTQTASGGALKSGDNVYILGDSITHGASAKYKELFGAKQITPTISGVTSRSWNGAGSPSAGSTGTLGTGKEALAADAATLKSKNTTVNGVIIALGTNGFAQSNPIEDVITTVKTAFPGAPIYWVNVVTTKFGNSPKEFNDKLNSLSSAQGYKVLDWAKIVDPSGAANTDPNGMLADGTHPNAGGYAKLGELVVNSTTSGGAAPAAATQGVSDIKAVLGETTTNPGSPAPEAALKNEAGQSSAVAGAGPITSLRDKIAQMMFVRTDSQKEANDAVSTHHVGGIFVSTNWLNGSQIKEVKTKFNPAPFVGIDQEGGQVDRIHGQPSAKELGSRSVDDVKKAAAETAKKLTDIGVTIDMAPVVDIENPNSEAIGKIGRAFSSDPNVVIEKARAFKEGLESGGITSAYKHFPGIGNTLKNSDLAAESTPPLSELRKSDLLPYEKLLAGGAGGAWVMISNYNVPELTNGKPATLSKEAYDLLKNDYKFSGIIITDDLKAGGLPPSLPDNVVNSIKAGADIALFTGESQLKEVIDKVEQTANSDPDLKTKIEASSKKILDAKGGSVKPAANAGGGCCSAGAPSLAAGATTSDNIELEYEDPARAGRKVGVTMWMPSGDTPKPLVIFAPGRNQNSKKDGFYKRYIQAIASKGFVVAGMNFPDNNSYEAASREADDVKFVIDKLAQEEKVKSKVDPAAGVGVVGHSDGGFVSLMSGYAQGKKHDRVAAVIAADGAIYGGVTNVAGPPLLLIHGDSDTVQNISSSVGAYNSLQTPYTAFAKMKGGDHDKYVTQDSSQLKDALDEITGAFLTRFLTKNSGDATDLKKIADSKKDKIDFQEKGSNAVTGDNSAASTALAAANPSASCSCTVASTLSGSNNEEKAWNFLVSKGFSAVQAAGAMGNLKSEGNFIPEQLEIAYSDPPHKWDKPLELPAVRGPAGQPGLGIAQWTTQGRKEKLLEAAKQSPENEQTPEIEKSVTNFNVQLNYLWTELSGPYKTRALDPIMKSNDLAEVVRIWQENYEVGAHFEPRFNAAKEYMTKFGSNAAGSSSPSSDSSSASSSTGSTQASGGGCGSTSGGAQGPTGGTLSWPIDPKASFVTQCYGGPSGHPGMDISTGNVDGHPIFAAADGVVTDAYDSGADAYGPNYVVIDHGNGLGTSYGHMRSMSVKKGDQVKQGQQIGEEGNLGYSKGTHLHFNAFPTPWPKNDSKNFNPLEHGLAVPSTVKNPHGCK